MPRSFNIAGPCDESRDYMLPAMARLPDVRALIERSKYFVVHAPRQVGKTTALLSLARELTREGRQVALLASVESAAGFGEDIGAAEIAIREDHVDLAKEILIARRATHLDSLAARLRERRVRAIIEPMLAGTTPGELPTEDVQLVIDLGLLRMTEEGGLDVANPIYREIIVRDLALSPRAALPSIQPTWLRADGQLDPDRLLEAFLAFWRQHGEALLGAAPYPEVAPHLVLMAFLHRVVNGGGTIEREYAIGRGRMDLCVRYGGERLAIELKVWRDRRPDPLREGLGQLDGYLAGLGLDRGWLVIFDQRAGQPPFAERTTAKREETPGGRTAVVVRG